MEHLHFNEVNSVTVKGIKKIRIEKQSFRWLVTINDIIEFTIESGEELPTWVMDRVKGRKVGWNRTITVTESNIEQS